MQFMELMENIYNFKEVGTGEDGMVWCGEPKGIFSVSSFYKFLSSKDRPGFSWQSIWIPGVPTKVAFFVWLAALDRVLTIDNLIRRRLVLVNWCCMCQKDAESISHLLLHCPVAYQLWVVALSFFGMTWVQPGTVLNVLWSWRGGRVGKEGNGFGVAFLFALCG